MCARSVDMHVWHPENDEEMAVCAHHGAVIVNVLGGVQLDA
jgi:hypothetical protein